MTWNHSGDGELVACVSPYEGIADDTGKIGQNVHILHFIQ